MGHAVASALVDMIENENLLENGRLRGEQSQCELASLSWHPLVGDIRGLGLVKTSKLTGNRVFFSEWT